MIEIELDAFSGRPNPRWRLNEDESRELSTLLHDLPATAPQPPGELGFRGFVIHRPREEGKASTALRVFGGTVQDGMRTGADVRGAEAWLMRSARQYGWGAVIDGIAPR